MSDRITAMEVQSQTFKKTMRGYDPDSVDLYLRSLAEELERLNLENGTLREAVGEKERALASHREREETLRQTLVSAQKMAEEIKSQSQNESELIVKEARLRAERLLADAQDQLAAIEEEIQRCRLERDRFENRLKSTVEEHLSLIEMRRAERAETDNLRFIKRRSGSEAAG